LSFYQNKLRFLLQKMGCTWWLCPVATMITQPDCNSNKSMLV